MSTWEQLTQWHEADTENRNVEISWDWDMQCWYVELEDFGCYRIRALACDELTGPKNQHPEYYIGPVELEELVLAALAKWEEKRGE